MDPVSTEESDESRRARTRRGCFIAALVVGGLGLLMVVGVGIAGYLWFQRNRDDFAQMGVETKREAVAFGTGKAAADCVQEGLSRVRGCSGDFDVMCQARARIFAQTCLGVANLPDGFCDGVPAIEDIMDAVRWRQHQCDARRLTGDQMCMRFFEAVQGHCHGAQ